MKNLIDQSGLVAGSDYLSLSRTLAMRGDYLIDNVAGTKHRLHRKAVKSIKLLELPTPYELWCQYGDEQGISAEDMLEIILFLNSIGGLEVSRSISGKRQIFYLYFRRLTKGLLPILRTRRHRADLAGISLTTLFAMQPLMLAVLVTDILAYGVNITIKLIVIISLGFLVTVWLSTIIHEWTHELIISRQCKSLVLIRRGMRIGILHRALPFKTEMMSAVLGPVVGAIMSLTFSLVIGLIADQVEWFLYMGLLVACLQLVSLLPVYGDGQVIWGKLRENLA